MNENVEIHRRSFLQSLLPMILLIGSATLADAAEPKSERVYFVKVKNAARSHAEFPARLERYCESLRSSGVSVLGHWLNRERLYLRVDVIGGATASGNAADSLAIAPFVESIISGMSGPAGIDDYSLLSRFELPERPSPTALRGFREKRVDFSPDTEAENNGEIIVKLLDEIAADPDTRANYRTQLRAEISYRGDSLIRELDLSGNRLTLIRPAAETGIPAAVASYQKLSYLEYAQPNYVYHGMVTPNDSLYSAQWNMTQIQAPDGWDVATDSYAFVGVLDTGIDYNHPDLGANVYARPGEVPGNSLDDDANGFVDDVYGYDFWNVDGDPMDDHNHGSHVAGIAGAVGDNSIGVAGTAWSAYLVALKVLSSSNTGLSATLASGIDYATNNNIRILNASLQNYSYDATVLTALNNFGNVGGIVVVAAGNNSDDLDTTVSSRYPANYRLRNQINVGNSTSTDAKYTGGSGSNYGKWTVDLFAPGTSIRSTLRSNSYGDFTGTSMSAPHVSGALSLARTTKTWETWVELIDRIRYSSDTVSGLTSDCMTSGRLNLDGVLGTRPRVHLLYPPTQVNTGQEIAITGFTITGPSAKRVAVVGRGISLSNPQLAIYNGAGTLIGSNDNYGSLSMSEQTEVLATPIPPASANDSAWIATLNPGNYTAVLSGVGGGTGTGAAVVHDIDQSTQQRLTRVSSRFYVSGSGNNASFQNVEVNGRPRLFYISAQGPSLSAFGISSPLADPNIEVYDGATLIASNGDWRSFDSSSTALEERLTNAGNAPSHNNDAGVMVLLGNGTYTVRVWDTSFGSGVALLDVMEF